MGSAREATETIGQRLRRLRKERGLSQRDIASPGVSYAYISRIEAEARRPSVKALRLLAKKLGVSAEYLETGQDVSETEQRELRLTDAELDLRLANDPTALERLSAIVSEALEAGDFLHATRARVALGLAAVRANDFATAVDHLEPTLGVAGVLPSARPDVYTALGRAYAALGMPERAVALFEECLAQVDDNGPEEAAARTRYATYLSSALTDLGDLGRAGSVLTDVLAQTGRDADAYTRIRLYWSLARLAALEGDTAVALGHARRAIALLEATEDTLQLARAHILCAGILNLQEKPSDARGQLEVAQRLLGPNADRDDRAMLRAEQAKAAALLGEAETAVEFARDALELVGDDNRRARGGILWALAEGLALSGDFDQADSTFAEAVSLLVEQHEWREAAQACRAWGRFLRRAGREAEALDVLERAADLAIQSAPAEAPRGR